MTTVTLIDGREVDSASPEWRQQCLAEWEAAQPTVDRHVATLLRFSGPGAREQRADYIATLTKRDGPSVADRVKAEFLKIWEKRQ